LPNNPDWPAILVAPQCLPDMNWGADAVRQFVEHVASRYQVDRGRIYLVGYSMGGYGTWEAAAANPQLFAAIVPICGGGSIRAAAALVGTPIWAFHGAQDEVVAIDESKRMVDAVRNAGGEPKLTVIPNQGHGICSLVFNDTALWEWLFQQHRNKR
jgi:predicted peptidase